MQKVDLPTSFTKLNENCGLPDIFTDYQIRHLGNPSGLPEILLKIDPCIACYNTGHNSDVRFFRFPNENDGDRYVLISPQFHLIMFLLPAFMLPFRIIFFISL